MLFLQKLLTVAVVFSVFVTLPTATKCDTSYYEKYHSARRFVPLKRTSLLQYNFTVTLTEQLASYERVALVGSLKQLGSWQSHSAVLLNRTQAHNVWRGEVRLPVNSSVSYRYFIAAVEQGTGVVQIRRWESNINARTFKTAVLSGNRTDEFGLIEADKGAEVRRGWLTTGSKIVQFKLFRKPLDIMQTSSSEQLYVKVQPIEPQKLTPILPSARANTEYVRMSYGNSYLREQPEFGVPYNDNDILMFHTTLTEMDKVAYLLKVYATDNQGLGLVRLIGYQYIKPQQLRNTEGNFTIDLISPIWLYSVGTVNIQYLVVTPLPSQTIGQVNLRTSFVDYWRKNWTRLEMGHRGLGKSLKQTTNAAPIIENTVASMKAATKLGADFVEFDVQLTSDFVPIICHDYSIFVCMNPKTPTSKDDLTEVLIKDITYDQLKNLKTYQVVGNKIVEYPAHNTLEQEDQRLFPLFADFLTKVNKSVGFDIEIKWPQLTSSGTYESIQTIDKNLYVDRIIEVMLQHGCGRLSFFTSFDADICTLLRYKQNMYPVMFLMSSLENRFADPRSDTIYEIINNAQAFDLAGVVPNAKMIKEDPNWIEVAKAQNKKIVLWGDDIKDTESIKYFKGLDPTGIIYDRMDLWLPHNKTNAFEMESDLPAFFQLQCAPIQFKTNSSQIDSVLSNVNFL
ncbi:glycerophosphocholine phosphodiesterase GPCPD1 [Teleopsis dalmanni]|uniref:glycerophosphocholine phosphodiesterase GPCPD1 n=1 Tax=Teleopsis dalmanni TaxID=139649 RepID=UPI0018CF8D40|nr:glycerophosphocholine phosphodiesterase GPCPD1 [Teleopsis dalmanni]